MDGPPQRVSQFRQGDRVNRQEVAQEDSVCLFCSVLSVLSISHENKSSNNRQSGCSR